MITPLRLIPLFVVLGSLFPLAAPPKSVSKIVTKETKGKQVQMEIDISGAKELFLEVTGAGDGTGYDWADWVEPTLLKADGTEKRLTDLRWKSASQAKRTFVGKNQDEGALKVNGVEVAYGIGTHADSRIAYDLPPGFTRFRVAGGIDDGGVNQEGSRPSIEFRVFTDPALHFARPLQATVKEGFRAEPLYNARLDREGSWVVLCVDHKGRLITSDRRGPLYRIELPPVDSKGKPAKVERMQAEVGKANGLLDAFGSLYVVGIGSGSMQGKSGLFRLRDLDGDDQYEKSEHLMSLQVGSDHHAHAVILSPDKKRLVILCGNNTDPPKEIATRNLEHQGEDQLLPRGTYYGHNTNRTGIGGFVISCDPDGANRRLHCSGFRNPYDIAFNRHGDLFTFDADMEYDVGGPWYRPTRVNHCVSGGEFGWRWGAGKWPDYYPDTAGTTVDIGRGSPTGVAFGYGAKFPTKYQNALYALDWTYGIIYAVHLEPHGGTYRGSFEPFLSGKGLPVSDVVIHPDGAMYFVTGGRRSDSKLVRVTYDGSESTAPDSSAVELNAEMKTRRALERFHGTLAEKPIPAIQEIWAALASPDRAVRYAARIALEHQPLEHWEGAAVMESETNTVIEFSVALARLGVKRLKGTLEKKLLALDFEKLSVEQKLDYLRAWGLVFVRLGESEEEIRKQLGSVLAKHYPSGERDLDRELCRMQLHLGDPDAVSKSVQKLLRSNTQADQMFYAYHLRTIKKGWSDEDLRSYFGWIQKAEANRSDYTGGGHFANFLKMVRREGLSHSSAEQKKLVSEQLVAATPKGDSAMANRKKVADWTVKKLEPALARIETGRSYIRGKTLYQGLCATCHLFNGGGGALGPDLSSVGGRYDYKTFLTEIVEPSKVISDQHASVILELKNGKVVVGREVGGDDDVLNVAANPTEPEKITKVTKADIVKRTVSPVSLMPPGLLNTLTEEEVLDLMMYVSSGGKVGHTAFQK